MSNTTQTDMPLVDANHLGNVNQPTANNDWWICSGVVPMDFVPNVYHQHQPISWWIVRQWTSEMLRDGFPWWSPHGSDGALDSFDSWFTYVENQLYQFQIELLVEKND